MMKNFLLSILLLVLTGEAITLFLMNKPKSGQKVLAEATIMPTPTSIPVATPTSTPTPKPKSKPKRTPTPVPQPTFSSQQINGFIDQYSGQYGVDPNVIRYIAICEAGFKPSAKNYIYGGLFQFGPITWENIRAKMGKNPDPDLRFNGQEAVQTAAYAVSIGDSHIWPHCYP